MMPEVIDVIEGTKGYAKIRLDGEQGIDNIAVRVIENNCPDFLLPMSILYIDDKPEIKYEMVPGERMEYIKMSMKYREFRTFLKSLLTPFISCSDWFMDYHCFMLNKNYIVLNKDRKDAKWIYIPAASYKNSDRDVLQFFQKVIIECEVTDKPNFNLELMKVINRDNATLFSLMDYLADIDRKENAFTKSETPVYTEPRTEERPQPAVKQNVQPEDKVKGFMSQTKKTEPAEPKRPGINTSENSMEQKLFGGSKEKPAKHSSEGKSSGEKGGGLLGSLFKKKEDKSKEEIKAPKNTNPIGSGMSLGNNNGGFSSPRQDYYNAVNDDATMSIDDGDFYDSIPDIALRLENASGIANLPELIKPDLSKGHYVIGRYDKMGAPQADFNFPAELSFISRQHFLIKREGSSYSAVDLDSRNGTFLNGEKMIPNMPYSIKQGDRIGLSMKKQVTYQVI